MKLFYILKLLRVLPLLNFLVIIDCRQPIKSLKRPFELSGLSDSNRRRFIGIGPRPVQLFYILKLLQVLTPFNLGVVVAYRHPINSWTAPFELSQSADSNRRRFIRIGPRTMKLFSIVKMLLPVLILFNLGVTVGYRCP